MDLTLKKNTGHNYNMIDDSLVSYLTVNEQLITSPIISLRVQNSNLDSFVDTGSKVSLIGESSFKNLHGQIKVKQVNVRITSITHNVIPVLG